MQRKIFEEIKHRVFVKKNIKYLPPLIFAMAALTLFVGVMVTLYRFDENNTALAHAAADSSASDTHPPTESEFENYTVAADLPRYILIPAIKVRAMVGSTGLTSGGAIGTPSTVFTTDWFSGSSKPGQAGATLIDGHVEGFTAKGVFYNLNKLHPGDSIQVEKGNGIILNYTVVASHTYDANSINMNQVLSSAEPGRSGLNLITCAGDIMPGTHEFNERIVIFSEQST
jgi:sortase (surface protein transpeptidase)